MAATATQTKPLKVYRSSCIALFVEMSFLTADKWPDNRMKGKIQKLPTLADAEVRKAITDPDSVKLLDKLLEAVKAGRDIELLDDPTDDAGEAPAPKPAPAAAAKTKPAPAAEEDGEAAPAPKAKKAATPPPDDDDEPAPKPAAKKAAAVVDDDDDDDVPTPPKKAAAVVADEDDEPTPAKPEKAKKKGTRPMSAGGEGKPGIIATIQECLTKASKETPVTKDAILNKLVKRFPDRDPDAMKNTINIQVPNRMRTDKKLNIVKTAEGGYYIQGGEEDE